MIGITEEAVALLKLGYLILSKIYDENSDRLFRLRGIILDLTSDTFRTVEEHYQDRYYCSHCGKWSEPQELDFSLNFPRCPKCYNDLLDFESAFLQTLKDFSKLKHYKAEIGKFNALLKRKSDGE